jgi:hypothetical protein
MIKSFGYDDILIVITLVIVFFLFFPDQYLTAYNHQGVLIAGDVVISNMVSAGMGRHLEYLPDPTHSALQIAKWNAIYQILNISGALLTKVSIGLFLLRLKQSRKFAIAVWGVLTPLFITTLILCFVVGLQCIPLRALWTPTIKGHCISTETPLNVSYVQSAFAILADLFLTVSPIVILWKVQISLKKKIGICVLMSLGLMATIANALRNAFIPNLTASDETCEMPSVEKRQIFFPTNLMAIDTIVPVVLVADLEFSLGTIAACMPTLMPLFKRNGENNSYNKMSGMTPTAGSGRPRNMTPSRNQYSFTDATRASRHSTESEIPLKSINQHNQITMSKTFAVEHSAV